MKINYKDIDLMSKYSHLLNEAPNMEYTYDLGDDFTISDVQPSPQPADVKSVDRLRHSDSEESNIFKDYLNPDSAKEPKSPEASAVYSKVAYKAKPLLTNIFNSQMAKGQLRSQASGEEGPSKAPASIEAMVEDIDPSIEYPCFIFKNPKYIDDVETAIERGMYFEPRTIFGINPLLEDYSNVQLISEAALEARRNGDVNNPDYWSNKNAVKWSGSGDKKIPYCFGGDGENIYIALVDGKIWKKWVSADPDELSHNVNLALGIISEASKEKEPDVKIVFKSRAPRQGTLDSDASMKELFRTSDGLPVVASESGIFIASGSDSGVTGLIARAISQVYGTSPDKVNTGAVLECISNADVCDFKAPEYEAIWRRPAAYYEVWAPAASNFNRTEISPSDLISTEGNMRSIRQAQTRIRYEDLINAVVSNYPEDYQRAKEMVSNMLIGSRALSADDFDLDGYAALTLLITGSTPAADFISQDRRLIGNKAYYSVFYTFRNVSELYDFDQRERTDMVVPVYFNPEDNTIRNQNTGHPVMVSIDHIDGVHEHNNYLNLRLATTGFNSWWSTTYGVIQFVLEPTKESSEYEGAVYNWEMVYDDQVKAVVPEGYPQNEEMETLNYRNKFGGLYTLRITAETNQTLSLRRKVSTSAQEKIGRPVEMVTRLIDITENGKRAYFTSVKDIIAAGYYIDSEEDARKLVNSDEAVLLGIVSARGGNLAKTNNISKEEVRSIISDKYNGIVDYGVVVEAKAAKDKKDQSDKLFRDIMGQSTVFNLDLNGIFKKLEELSDEDSGKDGIGKVQTATTMKGFCMFQFGVRLPNEDIRAVEGMLISWRPADFIDTEHSVITESDGKVKPFRIVSEKLYLSVTGRIARPPKQDQRSDKLQVEAKALITGGYPDISPRKGAFTLYSNMAAGGKKIGNMAINKPKIPAHKAMASSWKAESYERLISRIEKGMAVDGVLPPPGNNAVVVHHINGIPSDYRPDNLEWIDYSDNSLFEGGLGVALFRIMPGTGEEIPIRAWSSMKAIGEESGPVIDSPDGDPNNPEAVNIDLGGGRFVDRLEKRLDAAARFESGGIFLDKVIYILRRVVLKDRERYEMDSSEKVKDIIGYENFYNEQMVCRDMTNTVVFNTDVNAMSAAQQVSTYLRGNMSPENLDKIEDRESFNRQLEERVEKIREDISRLDTNSVAEYLRKNRIMVRALDEGIQYRIWGIDPEEGIPATFQKYAFQEFIYGTIDPDVLPISLLHKFKALYESRGYTHLKYPEGEDITPFLGAARAYHYNMLKMMTPKNTLYGDILRRARRKAKTVESRESKDRKTLMEQMKRLGLMG